MVIAARRRLELGDEPVEDLAELLVLAEGEAALADELGVPAAVAVGGRQAARERLEQRVRAGIVPARREVHVLRPQQVGERTRVERPDDADALERRGRAARERELEARVVEVPVEPGERVAALARVVRPARRHDPDTASLERLPPGGRVEDRRIDRIRNHDRAPEIQAELAVPLERVPGLEDRRGRELGVDPRDPRVRAVVEAAVDPDRAVDAVHHPGAASGEAPEAREVEVERVEEARRCAARDAVELDLEPAAVQLAGQRPQKLVAAARRRRRELVEDREIRSSRTRADQVDLGAGPRSETAPRPARRARDVPRVHDDTLTSPAGMPSTSRLAQAVRRAGLPRRTRAGLLRTEVARRMRHRDAYAVPMGAATVYLSHDDYEIDWASLAFVVVDDAYAGRLEGCARGGRRRRARTRRLRGARSWSTAVRTRGTTARMPSCAARARSSRTSPRRPTSRSSPGGNSVGDPWQTKRSTHGRLARAARTSMGPTRWGPRPHRGAHARGEIPRQAPSSRSR